MFCAATNDAIGPSLQIGRDTFLLAIEQKRTCQAYARNGADDPFSEGETWVIVLSLITGKLVWGHLIV